MADEKDPISKYYEDKRLEADVWSNVLATLTMLEIKLKASRLPSGVPAWDDLRGKDQQLVRNLRRAIEYKLEMARYTGD